MIVFRLRIVLLKTRQRLSLRRMGFQGIDKVEHGVNDRAFVTEFSVFDQQIHMNLI